jgi:hypothetical protein
MHETFLSENLKGRTYMKDLGVDGSIIKIGWEDVDFILLPQDMDQWRALVNAVMNLEVGIQNRLRPPSPYH